MKVNMFFLIAPYERVRPLNSVLRSSPGENRGEIASQPLFRPKDIAQEISMSNADYCIKPSRTAIKKLTNETTTRNNEINARNGRLRFAEAKQWRKCQKPAGSAIIAPPCSWASHNWAYLNTNRPNSGIGLVLFLRVRFNHDCARVACVRLPLKTRPTKSARSEVANRSRTQTNFFKRKLIRRIFGAAARFSVLWYLFYEDFRAPVDFEPSGFHSIIQNGDI